MLVEQAQIREDVPEPVDYPHDYGSYEARRSVWENESGGGEERRCFRKLSRSGDGDMVLEVV